MKIERYDLIENPAYHMDHAERFLLVEPHRTEPEQVELKCGNGNSWPFPDGGINHGHVVEAYIKLRKQLGEKA